MNPRYFFILGTTKIIMKINPTNFPLVSSTIPIFREQFVDWNWHRAGRKPSRKGRTSQTTPNRPSPNGLNTNPTSLETGRELLLGWNINMLGRNPGGEQAGEGHGVLGRDREELTAKIPTQRAGPTSPKTPGSRCLPTVLRLPFSSLNAYFHHFA